MVKIIFELADGSDIHEDVGDDFFLSCFLTKPITTYNRSKCQEWYYEGFYTCKPLNCQVPILFVLSKSARQDSINTYSYNKHTLKRKLTWSQRKNAFEKMFGNL